MTVRAAFLCGLLLWGSAASASAAGPDFVREVRPILEARCYDCHGPEKRKGDLRLSNKRDAFTAGDSGIPVIVPGDASLSILYQLVVSSDAKERMPKDKPALPAAEAEVLRRWIEAGAAWPDDTPQAHWAYVAPARPAAPEVRDRSWPANDVDRFILARLERDGLAPSPAADRTTLLRRVSLDLIGLPPTSQEVEAFVSDPSPASYEKVVDRLLASPRFGEHWARGWLDLARYADSTGYQADVMVTSWPYRDWVIAALNADMPFDRFTVEQLAGDLLPDPSVEQRIATGFLRVTPLNVEAGVVEEESRVQQVVDRIDTIGTVWLGTTLECAQCHNHKFDPFTQAEYYRLFAFLNNTPLETSQVGDAPVYLPGGPRVAVPLAPETAARRRQLEQEIARAEAELEAARKIGELRYPQWREKMARSLRRPVEWRPLEVVEFTSATSEKHRILPDGSVLLPALGPESTVYTIDVRTDLSRVSALRLEVLPDASLPGGGPGRGDATRPSFVLSELRVERTGGAAADDRSLAIEDAVASDAARDGPAARALDGDPKTGWSAAEPLGREHAATFIFAERVPATSDPSQPAVLRVVLEQNGGLGQTIGRFRLSATDAEAARLRLPQGHQTYLASGVLQPRKERALTEFYTQSYVGRDAVARLKALRADLATTNPPQSPVMEELAQRRTTHLMRRGNYLDPGEEVSPGTPVALHPFPGDAPPNRLGLARWLASPANPLVARVTVNRWWATLFGRGLVATQEDFGRHGDPPSHPELLDWLAVELMDGGWSTKRLLKTMVMSATYRQASRITPELRERDPQNELFARASRLRLPAETIRDNALAIGGLLSARIGGPPAYPPQPAGLWSLAGSLEGTYREQRDESRFRRGVYVVWRRTAANPGFLNFDAPDRSHCTVARRRTNTPLQALTLMNDQTYVEAALALAGRIVRERRDAGAEERLRHGFVLALGREPAPGELATLMRLTEERAKKVKDSPQVADALLTSASTLPPSSDVDPRELAVWFVPASVLLNLDETVTRG